MRIASTCVALLLVLGGCATPGQPPSVCRILNEISFPMTTEAAKVFFRSNGTTLVLVPHLEPSADSSGTLYWSSGRCSVNLLPIKPPGDTQETIAEAKFQCRHFSEWLARRGVAEWLTCLRGPTNELPACGKVLEDELRGSKTRAMCSESGSEWFSQVAVADPSLVSISTH